MTIDTATGLEAPAELSSEGVRDIFSHIARKYERFNAPLQLRRLQLWLAGMMRQAPIDESHDVLDIAGGHRRRHLHRGPHQAPRAISSAPIWCPRCWTWRACTSTRGRRRCAHRFRGRGRPEHPLRGRLLRRHHHGLRHPQHARPAPGALRDVPRVVKPGGSLVVPGVLHAAQWRMAGAVPLLPRVTSSRSGAA